MRKLFFCIIILAGIAIFAASCGRDKDVPTIDTQIYFADTRLGRLLPYSDKVIDGAVNDMAQEALDKIIAGRDSNDNIRRIVPQIDDCLKVTVDNNIAYVDILSEIKDEITVSRDIEKLFIYQVVNTLTSIKGIRFVKFTIDGEIHKNFLGFYDMRDVYSYTYPE